MTKKTAKEPETMTMTTNNESDAAALASAVAAPSDELAALRAFYEAFEALADHQYGCLKCGRSLDARCPEWQELAIARTNARNRVWEIRNADVPDLYDDDE